MGRNFFIGIAEWKIASSPDKLLCSALGSCVGVCLYDRRRLVCGVVHVLLPLSGMFPLQNNPPKFADQGVEFLIKQMERHGSARRDLTAKIVGGAALFEFKHKTMLANIGTRNVETVKSELQRLNIPITAEDTGDVYGRSVIFDPANGDLHVRALKGGNKVI
ncbi:MAG: chemotaxis protein CheD [Synergistaceae bacterium]|nr:chemotaxis protein CheD [Synergistaceae bacterium]